jgi:putative transposase
MSSGVYDKFTGHHNRRSIRLHKYNYAQPGAYFVTICVHNRKRNLFGDVVNRKMVLNDAGKYAFKCWMEIPIHFPNAELDQCSVMPNHIHGIICLSDRRGTACRAPIRDDGLNSGTACRAPIRDDGLNSGMACRAPIRDDGLNSGTACRAPTGMIEQFGKPTIGTIPTIIRSFKSATSKYIHQSDRSFKWQRNYYEHIIRDTTSLFFIRKYIRENPLNWDIDSQNPVAREIQEFETPGIRSE